MREQKKIVKNLSGRRGTHRADLEVAQNFIDDIKSDSAITKADLKLLRETLEATNDLLKDAAENLMPFEQGRESTQMTVLEVISHRLAPRRIYRTVYHGRSFIGPHIKKVCFDADNPMTEIMADIEACSVNPDVKIPKVRLVYNAVKRHFD
jgi:hypothetical protein